MLTVRNSFLGRCKMMANILVVDDSDLSLKQVGKFLNKTEYSIKLAEGAPEALSLIENNFFDIVITDKNMPGLYGPSDEGGMELLKHIQDNYTATEVIMMTGYASIETAIEAMKLGAFDYLIKPFTQQELLDSIQRLLSYKGFINPDNTISIYKEMHNEILKLMENQNIIDDEEMHHSLKSLDNKIDHFFKTQSNWEKIILTQRESLTDIIPLAERLKELVDREDALDLIDNILKLTEKRL